MPLGRMPFSPHGSDRKTRLRWNSIRPRFLRKTTLPTESLTHTPALGSGSWENVAVGARWACRETLGSAWKDAAPRSRSVTGIEVLGFPKIEIESKPQWNFQANFIKLVLEHKGGSAEGREVLQADSGLTLLDCFYKLETKQADRKRQAF